MNERADTPSVSHTIRTIRSAMFITAVYTFFSFWWLWLQVNGYIGQSETEFPHVYGIIALIGGLLGLSVTSKWGGIKSIMGKSIVFFSLGLIFQFFGQMAYSFYFYVYQIDVPYPSIGDIGFFGSIPCYILGIWFMARASGVTLTPKFFIRKPISIIIPAILLAITYSLFLHGYQFSENILVNVLDFGYPLLQATYISLAIVTYVLSRKSLGGTMRPVILFLLAALGFQFLSDVVFLYQAKIGTWYPGGVNDFLYLTSYFAMSVGLLRLRSVHDSLATD